MCFWYNLITHQKGKPVEFILALPIVLFFTFVIISYYMNNKKFIFTQNLIVLGILTGVYIALHFMIPHDQAWFFPLIQLGVSTVFFVLIIGALGTKISGATILSVTSLGLLSPSPLFLWVLGAGMLSIVIASILTTRNSMAQIKFLIQEISVKGNIDYSHLPEQQESLKGAPRTHFVPLYALIGVCIGILSYVGFYALI